MNTVHQSNKAIDHNGQPYDAAWSARFRRVSWGGILAGLLTAISVQILLSTLGLAIGFWAIEPSEGAEGFDGIATGTGIWWLVTGLISLALGGWVAARLAGTPNRVDGSLHGLVTWGLATFLSLYLVGTTVGMIISGAASALGTAFEATGSLLTGDDRDQRRRTSESPSQQSGGIDLPNINYDKIGNNLTELLRETDQQELKPNNLEASATAILDTAQQAARQAIERPDTAEQQLDRVLDSFFAQYKDVKQATDREALVNVLAANSDYSKQEAGQIIDRWRDKYQQTKKQYDIDMQELKQEAKQSAKSAKQEVKETTQELKQEAKETYQEAKAEAGEVADATADSIAAASMWAFGTMLAGLIAAMVAGAFGAPTGPAVGEITRQS